MIGKYTNQMLRFALITFFLSVLSCEKEYPEVESTDLTQYTILQGQRDFKPSPLPELFLGRGDSRFSGVAFFDNSCIYDWGTDRDQKDYNKLAGVSLRLAAPKNHSAVIVAWRPLPATNQIEVAPYFNYESGKFFIGQQTLKLNPNQKFSFHISQKGPLWSIVLFNEDSHDLVTASFSYSFISKQQWSIDPWFGGANNELGDYGGVASQDMTLWLGFERK